MSKVVEMIYKQCSTCYNYNKFGHIARFYRGKNEKTFGSIKNIDVNEEKEKMKMTLVKKLDEKMEEKSEDGCAPTYGADSSSRN